MNEPARGESAPTPEGTAMHRREAQALGTLRVAVLTVTDSRTEATDESGPLARRLLTEAGHEIARHALLPNDETRVRALVQAWLAPHDLHAVVITGGTGLGLAIVKQTIVAHGGQVEASSTPGDGTEIRLTIPTAVAVAAAPETP